jgi:hypothetical protein
LPFHTCIFPLSVSFDPFPSCATIPRRLSTHLQAAGFHLEQYTPLATEKEHVENGLRRVVLSTAHIYVCAKLPLASQ